ncbi:MAG: aminotransferase class IV [Proteobacteria bacterium]|nr:aminotransferase class IV [Pseudomonadota bacterium]
MSRISYLNGQFLPHENCLIHIEDRGFQFADGVYEVTLFENGKLIDGDAHIERFFRSLREMKIEHSFTAEELKKIQFELFAKNNLSAGTCYIQITRGAANRTPWFPKNIQPTISATVSARKKVSAEEFTRGYTFMTHEDIRWKRCDIKSVALFASSFVNQKAKDCGFDDAIFVRDGVVTEGSFANIFIVDANETLITKEPSNLILQGITRNRFIKIAKEKGIKVEERNFSVEEMLNASEVFLTSSSLILRPASKIDGREVGGQKRKIATILSDSYEEFVRN